jgi:hypothetical protein
VTIDYEDSGPVAISIAVASELLAAAARVIGHGRPLTAADLMPPGAAAVTGAADDGGALAGRAEAATQSLTALRAALATAADPVAIRATLDMVAGYNLSEALTATEVGDVGRVLDARLVSAAAADNPRAVLAAIFGTGLPIVPLFRPSQPAALGPALADEPGLGADPDGTVEGWLAQVARVTPAVDAWRDVQLYGRALGRDIARPRIVQFPVVAAGTEPVPWAGLGFDGEAGRPRSGLVSLALVGHSASDADAPAADALWCGLMLADWPEIIPAVEEEAGLTVQFDAPGAQAPQAVLIAVPPDEQPNWTYSALERTLLDTLQLAKIRALDLSHLGGYAQFIPMTFLAENTSGAAVSTSFAGLLVADATVEIVS